MSDSLPGVLRWSPRLLGIIAALFFGAFALDAADEGLPALLLHAARAQRAGEALAPPGAGHQSNVGP